MISAVRRLVGLAISIPVGALYGGVHGWRTGKHAILEVVVEPQTDALARQQLLLSLERVLWDPRVEAVVFFLKGAPGGRASVHDLRVAVRRLRDAGKATYAYLESATNGTVWIAAGMDKVFMGPTTDFNFVGVGVEMMFFGGALERLGLEVDVQAAGAYKSAGEMFTRTFASPANLKATDALLGDLQDQMLVEIASDRKLSLTELTDLLAVAPLSAEQAVVGKLVDRLLYEDQFDAWLEEHHGKRARRIPIANWSSRAARVERIQAWGVSSKSIAVLHLDGPIVMEKKGSKICIRAKHVVPILNKLREDDTVGAVVLHVNSPGGGVLASDLLWRAVDRLREEKPVVASFEDVSASGGVYLAAPATEILARPGTLTGSIGVVGMRFVPGGTFRRIGITTQTVQKSPNATFLVSASRPNDAQRARSRAYLERWYDGFVHRVASGRRKPQEAIEPHCGGRVWTGRMALERGLVDRLGTLEDAVDRARDLAGLTPSAARVDVSGQPSSLLQRLLRDLDLPFPLGARLSLAEQLFDRVMGRSMMERVDFLLEHEGQALALLPFEIVDP